MFYLLQNDYPIQRYLFCLIYTWKKFLTLKIKSRISQLEGFWIVKDQDKEQNQVSISNWSLTIYFCSLDKYIHIFTIYTHIYSYYIYIVTKKDCFKSSVHKVLFLAPQALSSQRHQAIGTGSPNALPVTSSFTMILKTTSGFPSGSEGKESACQNSRHRFSPWVGKIPWRRKRQPTPVFLREKSHGQRSLASSVHGDANKWDRTWQLNNNKRQPPFVKDW